MLCGSAQAALGDSVDCNMFFWIMFCMLMMWDLEQKML